MSSHGRLLVVSGLPRSGVTTIARALARSQDAVLVERAPAPPGSWLLRLAASELADEETVVAGGLADERSLLEVSAALAAGHLVVWDAGPVADAARAASAVLAADRLCARLDPDDRVACQEFVQQLAPLCQALPQAWFAVVVAPERGARRLLREAVGQLAVVGQRPDALIVNRVPAKRGGWPKSWTKRRRRRARALSRVGAGAGAAVVHVPIQESGRRLRRHLRTLDVESRSPRRSPSSVRDDGDGFAWHIPLVDASVADGLRVGRIDDDLVLGVGDVVRLMPLPSVLVRCRITGGGVVDDELVLRATPDPDVWRSAS